MDAAPRTLNGAGNRYPASRLSVVLCTYNGAAYVRCQLDSLLAQTRPPDELVVCDDGSSDETARILEQFQNAAPFPVKLYENSVRLGAAQNFGRAVSLATGELIALCDQDDQWLPTKLAKVEKQFHADPKVEAVFSDGQVVDSKLDPMGYTLWQQFGISEAKQRRIAQGRGLEVLIKHAAVTGATMTFRNSLLRRALPIPANWMHDEWFALIAAAGGGLRAIPALLICYRQHADNEIGARRMSLVDRWRETLAIDRQLYYGTEIGRYRAARDRVGKFFDEMLPDAAEVLDAKLRHLEYRGRLPDRRPRRIVPIFAELARLGYRRYSFGWQVAFKDFLLSGKTT